MGNLTCRCADAAYLPALCKQDLLGEVSHLGRAACGRWCWCCCHQPLLLACC